MVELKTWGERSIFKYEGTIELGTQIYFGNRQIIRISSEQYKELLEMFRGRTVNIGTSRTNPPNGSVGEWLINNISRVAISSYVGAILIHEGYAVKIGGPDIRFSSLSNYIKLSEVAT